MKHTQYLPTVSCFFKYSYHNTSQNVSIIHVTSQLRTLLKTMFYALRLIVNVVLLTAKHMWFKRFFTLAFANTEHLVQIPLSSVWSPTGELLYLIITISFLKKNKTLPHSPSWKGGFFCLFEGIHPCWLPLLICGSHRLLPSPNSSLHSRELGKQRTELSIYHTSVCCRVRLPLPWQSSSSLDQPC